MRPIDQESAVAPGAAPVAPDSACRSASYTWRIHLAPTRPYALVSVLAIIALSALATYSVFGHVVPAVAVVCLLFASLGEFLFPITFTVGPEGITRRNGLSVTHLKWNNVRRFAREGDVLFLSPLPAPSALDAYRAMVVRLPVEATSREHVCDIIQRHLPNGLQEDGAHACQ